MHLVFKIVIAWIFAFGVGSFVYLAQADEQRTHRIIENPVQDGNLVLRINDGGVKTDALTITGSTGALTIAGSLQPTSTTITSTGHTPTASNVVFRFRKVGDLVTMTWDEFFVTGTTLAGYFSFSTSTIPAAYRPTANLQVPIVTVEGAVSKTGGLLIQSNGSVRFAAASVDDSFNGVTSNGAAAGFASWIQY